MAIVTIPELGHRVAHLLQVAEDAAMNGLFLQRPVEALGHTIGLGLGHEGKALGDPPELDLLQEVVGGVLRAVIHAQLQALDAARTAFEPYKYYPESNATRKDLKEDLDNERYNPLVWVETSRHEGILKMLMADCVEAFSALPVLNDRELMENILYSGVWTRYLAQRKGESGK